MKRIMLIAFALLILTTQSAFARPTTDDLKTVNHEYGNFRHLSHGTWIETDTRTNAEFQYYTKSRNKNAIILHDNSRGVSISLNLFHQIIYYKDRNNSQWRPLYKITGLWWK